MACVRWIVALLLAHHVLEIAASSVHLTVKYRHHKHHHGHHGATQLRPRLAFASTAEQDSSHASSAQQEERITCPASGELLANATRPALTTACPATCSSYNLCIYYPQSDNTKCATTASRTCFRGDSCSFQCVSNAYGQTGWFLTLYDDDTVLDEINHWNAVQDLDLVAIPLDAASISQWVDDPPQLPVDVFVISIVGNEAANDIVTDGVQDYVDQKVRPRGEIVPFAFPASFLQAMRRLRYFRLENVHFPMPTAEVAPSLAFPSLTDLFLRNTMLTSFPLSAAALPALVALDLSVNGITDLQLSAFPASLSFLNLSSNAISFLNPNVLPEKIHTVDISSNNIGQIDKGSLPLGVTNLYLDNNHLTEIPADVAQMKNLVQIFLDGNPLVEIADGALPLARLDSLGIGNCSLTAIPKVIGSMAQLTAVRLSSNDFSRDPDFALLPPGLESLEINNCRLQRLPPSIRGLKALQSLFLQNNSMAVQDLSSLPANLMTLDLSGNGLEVVPRGLRRLVNLQTLYLDSNPLTQLAPRSLPPSIIGITLSYASFEAVEKETLPASLTTITIADSALNLEPDDIRSMRSLTILVLSSCHLQAFTVASQLPGLTGLSLDNNQLASFSGRYSALSFLDLRNNSLHTFNVSGATTLQTLHLAENQLASVPDCIFDMTTLLLLNLTGNPIRQFTPTAAQIAFFSRIPTVVFDQAMFSTDCSSADVINMRGFNVCTTNSGSLASMKKGSSKMSAGLVLLNVCLAIALVLLLATVWRRRKLHKKRLAELDFKTASLEKQQRHQSSASIWADTVLLHNRLDEDLVERKRLLGSGMFGDVWLATYKHETFALKQLKPSAGAVDRTLVHNFVEEIKLVSSLTHPRVVQFVGVVWTKESDIAMVTEYMSGGDLRSYLDEHPKGDDGWTLQMAQIALDITEAIVYLHSLDPMLIHRDLKSRNVLLDHKMRAKLSDFGISRYKLDDETMTSAVGTVRWVAPEVLLGKRYNESVDIYSLGIILSEIDTHKLPFHDMTDETGSERLTDTAIAGLLLSGSLTSSFSSSCPSEIRSLAERCTSFEPEDRPTGLQVAYELRMMLRSPSWLSHRDSTLSADATEDEAAAVELRSTHAGPSETNKKIVSI